MAVHEDDVKLLVAQLRKRISDLEDENQRLVEQLAAARAREQSLLHRPPSASRMRAMHVDAPSGRADKRPNEVSLAGIALTHDSGSSSSAVAEAGVAQSACDNWCVVAELKHQGAADGCCMDSISNVNQTSLFACPCSGREIPAASLGMHRLHCVRNIRRCIHCGKALPIKEFDLHVAATRGSPAALFSAVLRGDCSAVADMLQHGASGTDVCNPYTGDGALHAAARHGRLQVLEQLLAAGSAVNAPNEHGDSALHVVCGQRAQSARAALAGSEVGFDAVMAGGVAAGEQDNSTDETAEGKAPSHDADVGSVAATGPPPAKPAELVTLLLLRGADIEAHTPLGDTPMQVAQRAGNMDLAFLLSSSGSSLRPVSSRRAALLLVRACLGSAGGSSFNRCFRDGSPHCVISLQSSRDARRRPASARSLQSLTPTAAAAGAGGSALL
jgi:hypothetical protein